MADQAPEVCTSLRHRSRPTRKLLRDDHAGNSRRRSPPREYRPEQPKQVAARSKRAHRKRSTGLLAVSRPITPPKNITPTA